MTPEAPEHDEEPRIRITDRRRFAGASDDAGWPGPDDDAGIPGPSGADAPEGVDLDPEAVAGEAAQYLDHLRRLQAEFDNYRKRVQREMAEARDAGAAPVVARMLEVLDDFELALMHASEKPDFDRFLHGVELVYAKLVDSLKSEGLERMQAQGMPFDPEMHEAMMQTGGGEADPVVADVLRPGYLLKGRVLRPAGVRVERA
jgi:molecular chaperone GrpE